MLREKSRNIQFEAFHVFKVRFLFIFNSNYFLTCAVLCLERGIAGFPQFYRRCPLKMHPVLAYGRALKKSADFSLFKPHFRI